MQLTPLQSLKVNTNMKTSYQNAVAIRHVKGVVIHYTFHMLTLKNAGWY